MNFAYRCQFALTLPNRANHLGWLLAMSFKTTNNSQMTDESNLEFLGKIKAEKLTTLAEDSKNELAEIHADQAHWAKHGTNRSTRAAKSKSEIMEELSRERFPWEE